jgi:hypothetical protein
MKNSRGNKYEKNIIEYNDSEEKQFDNCVVFFFFYREQEAAVSYFAGSLPFSSEKAFEHV